MSDPRIIPDETLAEWADFYGPAASMPIGSPGSASARRIFALIEHGKALTEQVDTLTRERDDTRKAWRDRYETLRQKWQGAESELRQSKSNRDVYSEGVDQNFAAALHWLSELEVVCADRDEQVALVEVAEARAEKAEANAGRVEARADRWQERMEEARAEVERLTADTRLVDGLHKWREDAEHYKAERTDLRDQLQNLVDKADASKFHHAWIRTDDVRRLLEDTASEGES